MSEATKKFVQTKYFSQEFNAAIIDGPLRIYYAERHEEQILPFYFSVQDHLASQGVTLNKLNQHKQIFVLFYPTQQSFLNAFNWGESWGEGVIDGAGLCIGVDFSSTSIQSFGQTFGQTVGQGFSQGFSQATTQACGQWAGQWTGLAERICGTISRPAIGE